MVRVPISRTRVSPQVARDPGLIVDPAAFTGAIGAAQRFGQAALGLVRDIANIDDPADREKAMKRAAAQRKAVSNRVTAEGVREMLALRDSLERNAPPGADGFEQTFGQAAEETIARLAEQGADDQHRNEITQGLRHVGARIAEDARAHQAYQTVQHRRNAVGALHDAFAETIQRFPQMYEELRIAGVAAVLGDAANFDPVEQVERQKAFEAKAATVAIAGMAALDADGAEAALDDGRFDDVLDAGQKSQLRARIGLAREDWESELDNVRRNALTDMDRKAFAFLSDYRRKLAAGAATRVELMDAETAGAITGAQASKLRAAFDDAAARRDSEQKEIDRVSQVIDGGGRLDPLSDDDRIAVNRHFEMVLLPGLKGRPFIEAADAIISYVEQTGIVPKQPLDRIHAALLAGEPEEQMIAASTLLDIAARDPAALDALPRDMVDRAERLDRLDSFGIPADRAVQMADAETAGAAGGSADEPDFEPGDEPPRGGDGDNGGGPTAGDFRRGADSIAGGFDDQKNDGDAGGGKGLDMDETIPPDDNLTSGKFRRGADRISQGFDDQRKPRKEGLPPDVTKEEREKQKKMKEAIEKENERKRKEAEKEMRRRGRGPGRSGRSGGGGGGAERFRFPKDPRRPDFGGDFDFLY